MKRLVSYVHDLGEGEQFDLEPVFADWMRFTWW